MKFIEVEKYKVTCILEPSELFVYGITIEDIMDRKPGIFEWMRSIKQKAIYATDYNWPGCAYSSQIELINNGNLAITFSETIEDFVYNLRQTAIIDEASSQAINMLIERIESADEDTARAIIKTFETNVRNQGGMR